MQVTVGYIRQRYDLYNALIFGGKLPDVNIRLSKATRFLGKFEYKRRTGLFEKVKENYDYILRISTFRNLTKDELDDVIIHEMIHCNIACSRIKDSSAHGPVFRKMMNEINETFGRHLTISHKNTAEEMDADIRVREHIFCITELLDGKTGITLPSSTRTARIFKALPRYFPVRTMRYFSSKETYLNRFPRSNTPKIYILKEGELAKVLSGATEMVFDGKKLNLKAKETI